MLYALVLPAALLMGYLLATPYDIQTLGLVGVALALLASPLILKYHRPALFLFWNATVVVFFLPGSPQVWVLVAGVSLGLAILHRALIRDRQFLSAPSLVWPVVFLLVVVFITARLTGGIGLRALGGQSYGGKAYIYILAAVMGFFAMLAGRISPPQAMLYVGLFFLGAIANGIGSFIDYLPPSLYFLFWIFPVERLPGQEEDTIARFEILSQSMMCVFWFLLARNGIKNSLEARSFWRLFLLMAVFGVALVGGYRSYFVLMSATALILFCVEGLLRSRYVPIGLGVLLVISAVVIPNAERLPLAVQRSLSVLPIHVNPDARIDGQNSSLWRIEMWRTVLPEVPRYFWLGKGLGVSGVDLELARNLVRRGQMDSRDEAILTGAYHNGPLTVMIPFGIWGMIGWIWFVAAAIRALYLNYKNSEPELKKINNFLFAFLLARTFHFFVIFGEFRVDFPQFLGILGLSLAINGGIRRLAPEPAEAVKPSRGTGRPAARRLSPIPAPALKR